MIVKNFLVIGNNAKEVFYLGYRLKLTPCEHRILKEIVERGRADVNTLADACGFEGKKGNNVSVHICAINRKAEIIGGRRLILFENNGYYLNEFM